MVSTDRGSRGSGVPSDLGEVIPAALAAARAALRELDPDDIPVPLRKVAAASGRRLPPPLRRSLLLELDQSEWLRGEALEEAGELDPASRAFLERHEGWWLTVAEALATHRARTRVDEADQDERRVARLEARLEDAKAKLTAERRKRREAEAEARSTRKLLGRERSEAQRTSDATHSGLAEQVAELRARLEGRGQDLRDTQEQVADLTLRLRRMRKARAAAERSAAAGASGLRTDPVAMARDLDLAAAAVPRRTAAPTSSEPSEEGEPRRPFRLPHGVAPDSAAAVQWLLRRDEPSTVVVDGYNLLFRLDPGEFTTGAARRELAELMSRFVRVGAAVRGVIVVFDSALTGEHRSRSVDERVEMRFAPADRSADEEIVRLAGHLPGDVAVISSDREVIDGAAALGALPLWSEAIAAWRS